MSELNLAAANVIVTTALQRAREQNMKPMTVAVLDAGGHLLAFQRQDGSSILRPQIANAKAWGALGMGLGSRALGARAESHPHFFAALTDISGGRIVPVAGGVLVKNAAGHILGAVGVSGDLPDADEACAVRGIVAAGLQADTGA